MMDIEKIMESKPFIVFAVFAFLISFPFLLFHFYGYYNLYFEISEWRRGSYSRVGDFLIFLIVFNITIFLLMGFREVVIYFVKFPKKYLALKGFLSFYMFLAFVGMGKMVYIAQLYQSGSDWNIKQAADMLNYFSFANTIFSFIVAVFLLARAYQTFPWGIKINK